MSPAFGESGKSPCRDCEHQFEDKKKFEECINCEKRWGAKTRFRPERSRFAKVSPTPTKPCKWPWGCTEKTIKAKYCTEHERLRQDRMRRYKKKGLTREEMEPLLNEPIRKGPNRDSPKAMKEGEL